MDVTIRRVIPEDADALGHILVTAERHVFRGLVPDQCLDFTVGESAANWRKFFASGIPERNMLIVAETAEGNVVGYAWGKPQPEMPTYPANLQQISVLPDYQGRGVGRVLVSHIADYFAKKDVHAMTVNVLKINPHRAFYEHLGAHYMSEHPFIWSGFRFQECTYGWLNTQVLL